MVYLLGVVSIAGCNSISGAYLFSIDGDEPAPPDDSGSPMPAPSAEAGASSPQPPLPVDAATDRSDAAPPQKLVFVTSKRVPGNIGSAAAADAICEDAARTAGLDPKEWIAWISTGFEPAIARIEHDGPYFLVGGEGKMVVIDKAQLSSGVLSSAIDVLETGEAAPRADDQIRVWTGTRSDGKTAELSCLDWKSNSGFEFGILGQLGSKDASWTRAPGQNVAAGGWRCQTLARLYCFER